MLLSPWHREPMPTRGYCDAEDRLFATCNRDALHGACVRLSGQPYISVMDHVEHAHHHAHFANPLQRKISELGCGSRRHGGIPARAVGAEEAISFTIWPWPI